MHTIHVLWGLTPYTNVHGLWTFAKTYWKPQMMLSWTVLQFLCGMLGLVYDWICGMWARRDDFAMHMHEDTGPSRVGKFFFIRATQPISAHQLDAMEKKVLPVVGDACDIIWLVHLINGSYMHSVNWDLAHFRVFAEPLHTYLGAGGCPKNLCTSY